MNTTPIFVVGVPRSGTTFLHHLLNEHPQIRMSYEARLLTEGWRTYQRAKRLDNRQSFENLLRQLKTYDQNEELNRWICDGLTPDTVAGASKVASLFEFHRQNPSFQTLVEAIYTFPDPVQHWGNKMLRIEETPTILKLWPDARFIVLSRDPRAIYASQKKFIPTRRIKYSAIYYNLHTQWLREKCQDKDRYLIVYYERLVQDALGQLKQILRFIDASDEKMAEQMLTAYPAHTSSIDKWRLGLNRDEIRTIESLCFNEMIVAGYQPELAKSQRKMNSFERGLEAMLEYKQRVPLSPSVWYRKNLLKRFWVTLRGHG